MKFEISKNKLYQTIFRFLDNKNFVQLDPDILFFKDQDDKYQFHFKLSTKTCFISLNLVKEVEDFFSLNMDESINVISSYVENKLGVTVNDTYTLTLD